VRCGAPRDGPTCVNEEAGVRKRRGADSDQDQNDDAFDERRIRAMWECAYLYFAHEPRLTSEQIARRLFLSRSMVSRHLSEARRQGFIRVIVEPPAVVSLEQGLISRFGLTKARVVMTGSDLPERALPRFLGAAAAEIVRGIVRDGMSVGLAGGITINETVRALPPADLKGINVYALVGPTTFDTATSAAGLVRAMCDKYEAGDVHGHEAILYPPRDKADKARILRTPPYEKAYEGASHVGLALVGIGSLHAGSTLSRMIEVLELGVREQSRAVGDIGYQLFDAKGRHVPSRLDDLVISVPAKRLRELHKSGRSRVVAIAGGRSKLRAIRGALAGSFFDTLVTDEVTARELLDMRDSV
jgi:deoxyribonucleoside regulator